VGLETCINKDNARDTFQLYHTNCLLPLSSLKKPCLFMPSIRLTSSSTIEFVRARRLRCINYSATSKPVERSGGEL